MWKRKGKVGELSFKNKGGECSYVSVPKDP